MKLELHLLQNFAPSNLNRDDTGAPKDCEFGGHRRARISSQCQKRAVRQAFELDRLVDAEHQGTRTKRLVHAIRDVLVESPYGLDADTASALAIGAVEGVGLGRNKKGEGEDLWKTEYLLFVPRRIVREVADVLYANRESLAAVVTATAAPSTEPATEAASTEAAPTEASTKGKGAKAKGKGAKAKGDAKKAAQNAYPREVKDAVAALFESARRTVDVALFGRMIADKPEWNVDAACQVAHAISTNRVEMDFDFFTAVDDLKPRDTAGSDMMGTVQFNASCFYRYAVLDVDALRANLEGDEALLRQAIAAFVRGFVSAIPTGKQNSMAAHNFPSYALAVLRDRAMPLSLANAFLKPARPHGDDADLVDDSIARLESYERRLRDVAGDGARMTWADRDLEPSDGVVRAATIRGFYDDVVARAVGRAS